MIRLGMNLDHVASVRQARYRDEAQGVGEPDPVVGVHEAVLGGAACITMHLREDRRHVNDRDVELARAACASGTKFNLEMAATDEMVAIAERIRPHMVTLVPEGRLEVTTEGGLDVAGQLSMLTGVVSRIRAAGIEASAFIDPDEAQAAAAKEAGFGWCEVHTGPYAAAFGASGGNLRATQTGDALERVATAARAIMARGMNFNAGHALNYANVGAIAQIEGVQELHIGHSIVSRAVFTGLRAAVREMVDAIDRAREARR